MPEQRKIEFSITACTISTYPFIERAIYVDFLSRNPKANRGVQAKAEEARRAELTTARAQIQAIMKEYGLTLADFGGGVKQPKVARKPVEIKYKDDATGNTWTGRGRAPKWIEGKDKNQYLVR